MDDSKQVSETAGLRPTGRRRVLAGLGSLGAVGFAGAGFAGGRLTAPEDPAPMVDSEASLIGALEPFERGLLCAPEVYVNEWEHVRDHLIDGPDMMEYLQTSYGARIAIVAPAVFSQLLVGNLPPEIDQDALASGFERAGGWTLDEAGLDDMRRIGTGWIGGPGTEAVWADQCVMELALIHSTGGVDTGFEF